MSRSRLDTAPDRCFETQDYQTGRFMKGVKHKRHQHAASFPVATIHGAVMIGRAVVIVAAIVLITLPFTSCSDSPTGSEVLGWGEPSNKITTSAGRNVLTLSTMVIEDPYEKALALLQARSQALLESQRQKLLEGLAEMKSVNSELEFIAGKMDELSKGLEGPAAAEWKQMMNKAKGFANKASGMMKDAEKDVESQEKEMKALIGMAKELLDKAKGAAKGWLKDHGKGLLDKLLDKADKLANKLAGQAGYFLNKGMGWGAGMKELADKAEGAAQGLLDKQKEMALAIATTLKELAAKGEAWVEGHVKDLEDAGAETRSMTEEFTDSIRKTLDGGKDTPPGRDDGGTPQPPSRDTM